ncbi:dihydrofolate reductase [Paenibacillus filicis]|uniref:Dihydrofolate reductase n=1 Tax=Paenibacillus filicis TaxID=669464 RepID=A0ABU9DFP6_9BACL
MIVSLVAAFSINRVIGRDAEIPWRIPGEQSRFKELTIGKTIVMGRRTYESIGKPLPGRRTIVVSRSQDINAGPSCLTVRSLDEAYALLKDEPEIFIAGGGEIYREALPHARKLYLTVIEREIEGNIYFPEFDEDDFEVTYRQRVEGEIPYTYYTYERYGNVRDAFRG